MVDKRYAVDTGSSGIDAEYSVNAVFFKLTVGIRPANCVLMASLTVCRSWSSAPGSFGLSFGDLAILLKVYSRYPFRYDDFERRSDTIAVIGQGTHALHVLAGDFPELSVCQFVLR